MLIQRFRGYAIIISGMILTCGALLGGCSLLVRSSLSPSSVDSCIGEDDGTPCNSEQENTICVSGLCTPSQCGDGIIDEDVLGEQCELLSNGNAPPGCDPETCKFSCQSNEDCVELANSVDNSCRTNLSCVPQVAAGQTLGKLCVGEDLQDDSECSLDGAAGTCSNGFCVPNTCGNEAIDDGEDCDDGQNEDNFDGCTQNCTYTCSDDEQCSDGAQCNGAERCVDVSSDEAGVGRVCEEPSEENDRRFCPEDTMCFAYSCGAQGNCVETPINTDGDSSPDCTEIEEGCDPNDARSFPGASEVCDDFDNDCDGEKDNDTMTARWFFDGDGDEFGNPNIIVESCEPVEGHVQSTQFDCADADPNANPSQSQFFDDPIKECNSKKARCFDYNCDGEEEPAFQGFVECEPDPKGGNDCIGGGLAPLIEPGMVLIPENISRETVPCGEKGTEFTCERGGPRFKCRPVDQGKEVQFCR